MPPTFMHLNNFLFGEPSTSPLSREANTMHEQYPRSGGGGSSEGVRANTIIFIVVGIVCLFVIMAGFYFVSRHVARRAATSVPSSHPHSPIIHPPQGKREKNEHWKMWKTWRHASGPAPPTVVEEAPSSPVSPTPVSPPSPMIPARAFTYPSIAPRPSQARRVTSLSVTTSFSHSHITQEALNDFRVSAYDLDGDLETEMLNSARDDVWPGLPLAVVECCGEPGAQGSMEARGDAARYHAVDGSAQSYVPLILTTQKEGSDYENSGAFEKAVYCGNDAGGDTLEGDRER